MSISSASNLEYRKKEFKKGLDRDECRRQRENDAVRIRKAKREDRLDKKRREEPCKNSRKASSPAAKIDHDTVNKIYVNDPSTALEGLVYLRRLASDAKNRYNKDLAEMDIVPKLVHFLTYVEYPEHQYEASWILTNLISGASDIATNIIDNSMLGPHSVALLNQTTNPKLRAQVSWCLSNISGESKKYRDILISLGVIDVFIKNLNSYEDYNNNLETLRVEVWALSNMLRDSSASFTSLVKVLPTLKNILISCPDDEVINDTLWSLAYMSQQGKDKDLEVFVTMNIFNDTTMNFLTNSKFCTPFLRLIGNMVAGTDRTTQDVLDAGLLTYLPRFLVSRHNRSCKEACWILSNIVAGTEQQVKAVVDAKLIPIVISLMEHDKWDIRRECAYVFINLFHDSKYKYTDYIVKMGVIKPLVNLLVESCPFRDVIKGVSVSYTHLTLPTILLV